MGRQVGPPPTNHGKTITEEDTTAIPIGIGR
jgi:hypothetical protein